MNTYRKAILYIAKNRAGMSFRGILAPMVRDLGSSLHASTHAFLIKGNSMADTSIECLRCTFEADGRVGDKTTPFQIREPRN